MLNQWNVTFLAGVIIILWLGSPKEKPHATPTENTPATAQVAGVMAHGTILYCGNSAIHEKCPHQWVWANKPDCAWECTYLPPVYGEEIAFDDDDDDSYEQDVSDIFTTVIASAPPPDYPKNATNEQLAIAAAKRHGVPKKLFLALINQESRWKQNAVSPVGAIGLAQIMPATGKSHCGITDENDLFDPATNLDCGASYLALRLSQFKGTKAKDGQVKLALASYNAGYSRVSRLGRVPRISETQTYVKNICNEYNGC
jgi:hypothetical protein